MIEQSESIAALAAALSKAQAEIGTVSKTKDAEIKSKDPSKQSYRYKYADLADVVEAVSPVLAKHGLSVAQFPSLYGAVPVLATQIMHESGEWIRAEMELPIGENVTAQALGSAVTYCRRYAFSAALGIVTDKDDDGADATADRGGSRGSRSTSTRSAPRNDGPPPDASGDAKPTTEITSPQMNKIRLMARDLGVSMESDDIHEFVGGILSVKFPEYADDGSLGSLKQLTKSQGSYVIDQLTAKLEGR